MRTGASRALWVISGSPFLGLCTKPARGGDRPMGENHGIKMTLLNGEGEFVLPTSVAWS